ncbi:MAG TPA: polysaccharide deacetylase family protein [Chitinophagaceae bacterium]|nr:polysaccharide deacetylase family protein [Chitinophagaceae bacterium]
MTYLFVSCEGGGSHAKKVAAPIKRGFTYSHGAIIRGDSTQKKIALVFTGDEFADGGKFIAETLRHEKIKASFFLTGRFNRNVGFKSIIERLKKDGHYLGAHSNEHLLYCDWQKRDSLLVTEQQFKMDLADNYAEMTKYGITKNQAAYFLPPYEWYNDTISAWTKKFGLKLINFTPGTKSTADYTTPDMKNYRSSEEIYSSIINYEQLKPNGLNGFILLIHMGTDPKRTDKFYHKLPQLMKYLKTKGYQFQTVNQLLNPD